MSTEQACDETEIVVLRRKVEEGNQRLDNLLARVQELEAAAVVSAFQERFRGTVSMEDVMAARVPSAVVSRDRAFSDSTTSVGESPSSECPVGSVNVPSPAEGGGENYQEETVNRLPEYLPGSVYLWACGVKGAGSDAEVTATDMTVGWLTLATQMGAYVGLIQNAGDPVEGISYSLFSVGLAMYLMVVISAAEVRAGYALLFWGHCTLHRLFGACLLGSFSLLVYASMRVLFAEAEGNADLVIGAATVLFIADVDEKMMLLLQTKRQKWRLFWMLQIVGFSFWLALVGALYVGDSAAITPTIYVTTSASSSLFSGTTTSFDLHDVIPKYFTFAFTPGTLTFCAFILNSFVLKLGASYRSRPSVATGHRKRGLARGMWCLDFVSEMVRGDPSFAAAVAIWLIFSTTLGGSYSYSVVTDSGKYSRLMIASACILAVCFFVGLIAYTSRKLFPSDVSAFRSRWVPLFVGWGIGAGIGVAVVSDTELPSTRYYSLVGGLVVFSVGAFAVADLDFLGTHVGARLKPVFDVLQNADGIAHWAVVSSMEICMVAWVTHMYLGIKWGVIE